MGHYPVVARQTALSTELLEALQDLAYADKKARFTLLVPATPAEELVNLRGAGASNEELAMTVAADAEESFAANGIEITRSAIGPASPLEGVRQELARHTNAYDAVIVCTFPSDLSRWLRRDLPARIEQACQIPVKHVVAQNRRIKLHLSTTSQPRGQPAPRENQCGLSKEAESG